MCETEIQIKYQSELQPHVPKLIRLGDIIFPCLAEGTIQDLFAVGGRTLKADHIAHYARKPPA